MKLTVRVIAGLTRNPLHIIILLLLSLSVQGQEVYTLQKVLETGLERNYDIRIVRNEQKIADNNVTWGNAGMLPSLDLSAGYSGTDLKTTQHFPDGTKTESNYILNQSANIGLNLSWTIFEGFRMLTEYERLKEFQRMGEISTRLNIESLVANLSAEYYNYVRQTQSYANLEKAVKLSAERLRIVEARYSIGSLSRLDLQQARVDFNADSSRLIKQYEVVNTSRITLNQLMALQDVSSPLVIADMSINPDLLLDETILKENTMQTNAYLLLAQKNQALSEMDLKTLQSRNYPYLRINGGYGYNAYLYQQSTMDKQNTLGFNYGVSVGFTLFDGMNRRREQRNAKINILNKELQTEQLELSLNADLANMWMAYRNNIELAQLEEMNVGVANENYEIAMERYMLGDLSGIELREAQNSLLEAEERLLQAQYDTKLCEISLLQISGLVLGYLE
jgi:Outer membrane protein